MSNNDTVSCVVAPHLLDNHWPSETSLSDLNRALIARNAAPIAILGFIVVFGLIANCVMIYVFATKYRRSNYRVCSIWLASMDVVGCLTVVPFFIHLFAFEIDYPSDILCKTGITAAAVFLFSCHMILVVIAIERYMKIYHPFKRQISGGNLTFMFVICVLLSAICASPHAFFAGHRTLGTGVNNITAKICFVSDQHVSSYLPGKYYTAINLLSIIMSLFIIVMYCRIIVVISRFRKYYKRKDGFPSADSENPPLFSNATKTIEARRSIVTLISASASFIITTFPFTIMAMVALFTQQPVLCNVSFNMAIAFRVIASSVLLNTVANPFIYGFADNQFRQELRKMFSCSK